MNLFTSIFLFQQWSLPLQFGQTCHLISYMLAERLYSRHTFLPLWFWPLPPHCYLKVKEYLQVCHLIFGLINFIYSGFNALFISGYFCVDTHACLSSYMFIVSLFLTLKLLKLHWRINETSFLHATLFSLCLYNPIQLCSSQEINYIVFFFLISNF